MVLVEVVESSAGLSAAILCCGEHISIYDTSTYVLDRLAGCGFLLVSALVHSTLVSAHGALDSVSALNFDESAFGFVACSWVTRFDSVQ